MELMFLQKKNRVEFGREWKVGTYYVFGAWRVMCLVVPEGTINKPNL